MTKININKQSNFYTQTNKNNSGILQKRTMNQGTPLIRPKI